MQKTGKTKRLKLSEAGGEEREVHPTFLYRDIPSEEELAVASGKCYPEANRTNKTTLSYLLRWETHHFFVVQIKGKHCFLQSLGNLLTEIYLQSSYLNGVPLMSV